MYVYYYSPEKWLVDRWKEEEIGETVDNTKSGRFSGSWVRNLFLAEFVKKNGITVIEFGAVHCLFQGKSDEEVKLSI